MSFTTDDVTGIRSQQTLSQAFQRTSHATQQIAAIHQAMLMLSCRAVSLP